MNLTANAYTLPNVYAYSDWLFEQQELKAALFDAAFEEQIKKLTQDAWSFAAVISYIDQTNSLQDNPLNNLLFEIYLGGLRNVSAIRKLLIKATNELAKTNIKGEILK